MLILAAIALALWAVVLALPWQPWRCRERLAPDADTGNAAPGDITVLIPARDEAAVIGETLRALAAAVPAARIVLVDDQSRDDTVALAQRCGLANLAIVRGAPPPAGWTGKLWALQQGLARVATRRILLLDADIRLAPGMLRALARKADAGCALVSVCAEPNWQGWAARWLLPAFVYFFKLLYPFALANRPGSRIAAAAGGVVLVDRKVLLEAGGFGAWRGAIIDDCALAAHLKGAGHRCCIGLTRGAQSLRRASLGNIARMIARTAFVQLHESWGLLLAASLLLGVAFWGPVAALVAGDEVARVVGGLAWLALIASYLPTLAYYRRNLLAAVILPATATAFLAMLWYSGWRALAGTRSVWKGRRYSRGAR